MPCGCEKRQQTLNDLWPGLGDKVKDVLSRLGFEQSSGSGSDISSEGSSES